MKRIVIGISIAWLFVAAPLAAGQADGKAVPPSAAALIAALLEKEGVAAAETRFKELQTRAAQYTFAEREFNDLGYRLLQRGAVAEAIAVFCMNAALFPRSLNVYDSLAEGYLNAGDFDKARETYGRVLALDAENANARRMLANLEAIFARIRAEREHAYAPGQQTGIRGPYLGQEPPGKEPRLFAPGLVSLVGPGDYACTVSADSREFYFTRSGNPQVIMVCRLEKEGWSAPQPVSFSAGFSAHEPHLTPDKQTMYWGWFHPLPDGEPKTPQEYGIWASDRTPSGWGPARYVGQGMYVSSDQAGELYVTETLENAAYLTRAALKKGRFARLQRLGGGLERLRDRFPVIAHPAIAPDGSYIVFDAFGERSGRGLFVSFRTPAGEWGEALNLARHGIDSQAGCAMVSPDGKFLFYSFAGDIYWVSTALIEELRPAASPPVKK